MNARWSAALFGLAVTAACGGTEELALNPTSTTSSGGAGDGTMTTSGAGGSLAGSAHEEAAGSPSEQEAAGGPARGGEAPVACSTDLQCREPAPRCSESGSCVACASDDDCPLDGARRCDARGRCVACRESEDCADNQACDSRTGACQACSGAECTGTGGSPEGGKP
jgi:hypothetical protein